MVQKGPSLGNRTKGAYPHERGGDERLLTEGLGCLGGAGKACEAEELKPVRMALTGQ